MKRALATLLLPVLLAVVMLAQAHSGFVLCVNKIVNLPGLDVPDEPIELGFFISDDFRCVKERFG